MLQLSDGLRVWDVSGGQSHSLLLADGDCVQPVLLYCGQQPEPRAAPSERPGQGQRSPSRAESYTVRPTLLPFCSEVCVKGPAWLSCSRIDGAGFTLLYVYQSPQITQRGVILGYYFNIAICVINMYFFHPLKNLALASGMLIKYSFMYPSKI